MTLPGETLATGASQQCPDCKHTPELDVYKSAAGWYVGTYCFCGPYSRESGYWDTEEDARACLERWRDL